MLINLEKVSEKERGHMYETNVFEGFPFTYAHLKRIGQITSISFKEVLVVHFH